MKTSLKTMFQNPSKEVKITTGSRSEMQSWSADDIYRKRFRRTGSLRTDNG